MTSVDKITFQQTFPTGNYANMKLGLEMSLVPGVDDAQDAYVQAQKIVNDAFERLNPHIVWNDAQLPLPETQIKEKLEEMRGNSLVDDILSCKEIKVLESYKLLAKTKKEFQDAYDRRYSELQK